MARKKRVWYEGACYHVMGRGNRHCAIFKDPEDYDLFLTLLRSVREREYNGGKHLATVVRSMATSGVDG